MIDVKQVNDFSIIAIDNGEIKVELLNYGASIYSIKTKDILGNFEDVVLQYENLDDYLNNNIYLNATIGPIAGRVKNAYINIDNKEYHLDKNSDNLHCLHSGSLALSYKFFDFEVNEIGEITEVVFLYENTDVVNYLIKVIYRIEKASIRIDYEVESEESFVFNLTNHAYFNFSGNLKSDIKNHEVRLNTNKRHELTDELVVTGNVIEEKDIYNFLETKKVERGIKLLESTAKGGYDDIFYSPGNDLRHVMAEVYDPVSKRGMKVRSSYDHLVFYTHNNINKLELRHLGKHQKHYALCFECQKSPYGFFEKLASNPVLSNNQIYQETIIFEFFAKK
jgi:aldose 1-epimerase